MILILHTLGLCVTALQRYSVTAGITWLRLLPQSVASRLPRVLPPPLLPELRAVKLKAPHVSPVERSVWCCGLGVAAARVHGAVPM